MKIEYKHQRFQAEAARCVTNVFQGQPKNNTFFIQIRTVFSGLNPGGIVLFRTTTSSFSAALPLHSPAHRHHETFGALLSSGRLHPSRAGRPGCGRR